jgi:hypothetical protein
VSGTDAPEIRPAATSSRTIFLGFESTPAQSDSVAGVGDRGQADDTDLPANGRAYMEAGEDKGKNESGSSGGAGSFARAERSGARRHRVLRWLLGPIGQG